jgi:hypothetical protein
MTVHCQYDCSRLLKSTRLTDGLVLDKRLEHLDVARYLLSGANISSVTEDVISNEFIPSHGLRIIVVRFTWSFRLFAAAWRVTT